MAGGGGACMAALLPGPTVMHKVGEGLTLCGMRIVLAPRKIEHSTEWGIAQHAGHAQHDAGRARLGVFQKKEVICAT